MEITSTNPLANNFFYKFYNYNVEDINVINNVPVDLYGYVLRELVFYKRDSTISHMSPMEFNSFLFNAIKTKYTKQHEKLIKDLKS